MSGVDMSAEAVSARIRAAGAASSLAMDAGLDTKVDLSPEAVSRRIREASDLLALCLRLAARDGRDRTLLVQPPGSS